jgi:serine/threonine protein kinase
MVFSIRKMNAFDTLTRAVRDLVGHRGVRNELAMPEVIGDLKFIQIMFPERKHNKFQFGLYRDSAGKEYIAKHLSLKDPGMDEYWLRNELSLYAAFTNLYKEKSTLIESKFPDISIPQLHSIIDDGERLMGVMERVEGATLEEFGDEKKMMLMEKEIAYFRFLNTIHDFSKEVMTKRNMATMVAISLLATVGALLKNPSMAWEIVRGELMILGMSPWLITQTKKELIHRDVGYTNLLVGKEKSYVIDFELSSVMHPMFEITQMVIGSWLKPGFPEMFKKSETMRKITSSTKDHLLYKLLTIYSGIHALATHAKGTTTENKIQHLKEYLRYGLSL